MDSKNLSCLVSHGSVAPLANICSFHTVDFTYVSSLSGRRIFPSYQFLRTDVTPYAVFDLVLTLLIKRYSVSPLLRVHVLYHLADVLVLFRSYMKLYR